MQFCKDDETHSQFVRSLHHEFLRCRDAYAEFVARAPGLLTGQENREQSYAAYNAYARFVHHLYEFLLGCGSRQRGDTRPLRADEADRLITTHLLRILSSRRQAVLAGLAPPWGNRLDSCLEIPPADFATEFRRHRNIAQGHVGPARSLLDLSRFYSLHHPYLAAMLEDASFAWGGHDRPFPDLGAVTAFFIPDAKAYGADDADTINLAPAHEASSVAESIS